MFSSEFNDLIAQCLQKVSSLRPTATELLTHPFFSHHPGVIRRLRQLSRMKSIAAQSIGHISFDDCAADPYPPTTDDMTAALEASTGLTKLTEQVSIESAAPSPHAPSIANSLPSDQVLQSIRLQHLERILYKIQLRYRQLTRDVAREREGWETDLLSSRSRGRSVYSTVFKISKISKCFFKGHDEPMSLLPSLFCGRGGMKWSHLANQLHLPKDVVLSRASAVIDSEYFSQF